jgi:hypothetical protein
MKKLIRVLIFAVAVPPMAQAATTNIGSWTPLFQGVDIVYARVFGGSGERTEAINCLRIDLSHPDVELFTTPKCTNCSLETIAENTSHFLGQYGVQVAVNGGFYASSLGPGDVALGTAENVYGLALSRGVVVSPEDSSVYAATMFFSSNKVATFVPRNWPPVSSNGYYTAITGNILLLTNGVNVGTNANDYDPRTALGVSQDRRYLYLMTVDGRQGTSQGVNPPWSDGLNFRETADWLARFGAWDGMNLDGGGSTTMCMADCQGNALRLNSPSFVVAYGRERNIAQNFGVYAKRLPSDLEALTVEPGATTALITWGTEVPATTQVEYGLTSSYGSTTTLDSRLLKGHVATLTGLSQASNYFFRAISTAEGQTWTEACQFTTLTSLTSTQVFGLNKTWTYTTNNLDGVNWKAPAYNDSGWLGSGPGLLYVENSANVAPKGTALFPTYGQPIARTYYFRSHFTFTGSTAGASLIFSNYVDDGAVFYLNGAEIYRLRMPAAPTAIAYSTAASGQPCAGTPRQGDAETTCPDVFPVSGNLLTNLVQGDNVLAVEVHNYGTLTTGDIVFGMALIVNTPPVVVPRLSLWMEGSLGTLFWNEDGFTLQESTGLNLPPSWSDVPGSVTRSPVAVTNTATRFYRLRN